MKQEKTEHNLDNIKLIFAIGNPETEYEGTKHNIGISILKEIAKILKCKLLYKKKINAYVSKYVSKSGHSTILSISDEYINNSGTSLLKIIGYYKIRLNDILIMQDEINLEFLETSLKFKGSARGHNGIKDIIQKFNTNRFYRLKIGIGTPGDNLNKTKYVLSRFSEKEKIDIIDKAHSVLYELNNFGALNAETNKKI